MITQKEEKMPKPIQNLLFSNKYPDDRELLAEAIAYSNEIPGATLTTNLRILLLRILPEERIKLQREKVKRQNMLNGNVQLAEIQH